MQAMRVGVPKAVGERRIAGSRIAIRYADPELTRGGQRARTYDDLTLGRRRSRLESGGSARTPRQRGRSRLRQVAAVSTGLRRQAINGISSIGIVTKGRIMSRSSCSRM